MGKKTFRLFLLLLRLIKTVTTLSIFPFVILTYISEGEAQEQNELSGILKNVERVDFRKLQDMEAIYKMDVYYYFSDEQDYVMSEKKSLWYSKYDTPLKRKVFENTPEYKKMMSELKMLREQLFKNTYYIVASNDVDRYRVIDIHIHDYDIKRKGFPTDFGHRFGCEPHKSGSGFYLIKSVPTGLFLPVEEEKGLFIENNKRDTEIYFIFKITGRNIVSYKRFHDTKGCITEEEEAFLVGPVRVVFANRKTGEIYYNKVYK